jgi:GntR family transcriptional regulator
VHGSGTYAVEPKVQLPIRLASYTRDVSDQGLRPTSRIVSLTKDVAGEAVAYALGIREGAKVWRLERVRRTDATPLAFECAYLPVDRFPNLKRLLRDDDSLYEIVQREYTCTPSRAVQSIETAMAEPEHYELLEADNSMPMLMLVRTTYDQAGVAFEHVLSVFRGDRCRLVSVLLPQP